MNEEEEFKRIRDALADQIRRDFGQVGSYFKSVNREMSPEEKEKLKQVIEVMNDPLAALMKGNDIKRKPEKCIRIMWQADDIDNPKVYAFHNTPIGVEAYRVDDVSVNINNTIGEVCSMVAKSKAQNPCSYEDVIAAVAAGCITFRTEETDFGSVFSDDSGDHIFHANDTLKDVIDEYRNTRAINRM